MSLYQHSCCDYPALSLTHTVSFTESITYRHFCSSRLEDIFMSVKSFFYTPQAGQYVLLAANQLSVFGNFEILYDTEVFTREVLHTFSKY